ncbi:methyltransferase [Microbulbifer guangxiensis]|uniref:methyltransferase n=1 Tax=Microbulbifer guangxiensis TaxID=2904249 RepID=UPI001F172954|nr:methyltransferase [Microbulbifer guangxiensis]
MQAHELSQRFEWLDRLLAQSRQWWQVRPFHHRDYCWAQIHPDLCQALDALEEAELHRLQGDIAAASRWLSPWLEGVEELQRLSVLPRLTARQLSPPERLDHGIPGRKWQQILAFAGCIGNGSGPLLEWCAGKGHLGRLISSVQRRPVTSLEWQAQLCRKGEALADRRGVSMRFVHCDAFSEQAGQWVRRGEHAVALHACGDLHTTLMRHWRANQGASLTISPCCYHVIRTDDFVPMSQAGEVARVKLAREDLHLPLQETVTAGAGVRRLRERELHWRMAFDELQRELRGQDRYLPVPNVRKGLLKEGFPAFASWAAARKRLDLLGEVDEEKWLALGWQRLQRVRRMELVTHVFRRPLELWLVLDRALYLQEGGARVQLGEFCDREITPRNILITAER